MPIKLRILLCVVVLELLGFGLLLGFNLRDAETSMGEARQRQIETLLAGDRHRIDATSDLIERSALQLALLGEQMLERRRREPVEAVEASLKAHLLQHFQYLPESIGGGLWFEPNRFDPKQRLYGPYVFRGDKGLQFTWELSQDDYNYPEQVWYQTALPKDWPRDRRRPQSLYWSPPYLDQAGSQALMLTASVPIYDSDGRIAGLATVDWPLTQMGELIAAMDITPGTQPFLIDRGSGLILSLVGDESRTRQPASELGWGKRVLATARDFARPTGAIERHADDAVDGVFAVYATTSRIGLILGARVPQDEIMAPLQPLLQRHLASGMLIALLSTLLMAGVLVLIFRPFTRMLRQIGRSIHVDETHGHVELSPLRIRGNNEFTPIVHALNQVYSQVDAYTRRLAQANFNLNAQQLEIRELNASLERKVAERTGDLVALGEIGKELTATLDMEQTFERLYRRLNAKMDARAFLIGLYDAEHGCIHVEFCMEDRTRLVGPSFDMGDAQRPAVRCVAERVPIIVPTLDDLKQLFPDLPRPVFGEPMESVIYLPLVAGERMLGCLSVQSPQPHAFSDGQIEFVRILASYTAIAVDNALSYTKLKRALSSLQHAQEQLVINEKMAAAGQLTAGVAHEINNPTNFVYGAAQNLEHSLRRFRQFLLQLAGEDTEPEVIAAIEPHFRQLGDEVDNIIEGSRRIRDIVRDLRAFSRLDEAEEKSVSIVESMRATLSLIGNRYRQHVMIETDLSADAEIHCYPARINQAFMNIIVNACQAVEVRRRHAGDDYKGVVWISTQIGYGELHIAVEDNGCGMDDTVRGKVFEPFFTTRALGEGIGLGLSVAYGIVKDHGGDIDVESIPGQGSRFTVRLPLHRSRHGMVFELEPDATADKVA